MKSVLFCISLLSVTSLFAQKVEVGLSGGAMFKMTLDNRNYDHSDDRYLLNALHAAYNSHYWQYRIAIGYGRHTESTIEPIMGGINPIITITKYTRVPVLASVNRKIRTHHFELYGGFCAGITFAHEARRYVNEYNNNSEYGSPGDFSWFSAGLNAGGTYFISKHFGLNMNAAALYNGAIYFPLTSGVVYAFK
jgi:hypothetical protein